MGSDCGSSKDNIGAHCALGILTSCNSVIQNRNQAYNGEYQEKDNAFFDKGKEEIGCGPEFSKVADITEDIDGPTALPTHSTLFDLFDG